MVSTIVPPDGGWGWLVVFASFMIHLIADGLMYSFGIFYVDLIKQFGSSKVEIAWIASIMSSVTMGAGPLVSALVNRYGCRSVNVAGSLMAALALVCSTWARHIGTLYLTLGLMLGAGFSLIYLPAIVSVTCYFEKRRAFATGIAVCGSGIGTFILSPLTEVLLSTYGWKSTMLVLAAFVASCSLFGLVFRPLEPQDSSDMEREEVSTEVPELKLNDTDKCSLHSIKCDADSIGQSRRSPQVKTNGDWSKFSTSQPLLTQTEVKAKNFGSSRVIYIQRDSLKKKNDTSHLMLMKRKDIFYSGSINNISSYRSNPEMYEKSVVGQQTADDADTKVVCGCWSCRQEFWTTLKDMTGIEVLKDRVFVVFLTSAFLTGISYFVPYVYIADKAISSGVDSKRASYLLSIIGISNTAARFVLGYVSDRPEVNRLYLYASAHVIAGFAMALTGSCTGFTCLAFFGSLFGMSMGVVVSLTSVLMVDILGLDRLTNAFGLMMLFNGVSSLIGPPLTGALYDATNSYNSGFILCGIVVVISGVLLLLIPYLQRPSSSCSGASSSCTASSTVSPNGSDKKTATDSATISINSVVAPALQ